jgi:hypothetical protein
VDELIGADKKATVVTEDRNHVDPINERYAEADVFVLVTDYLNYATLEKANIPQAVTVFLNFEKNPA